VTISSAEADKFHYFNNIMGNRIRKFSSSVFGRDIEDWAKDVQPYLSTILNPVFISGDLKSATDLLHSMIMEIACDELVKEFNLSTEDEELLRGYSYRAVYYKRDIKLGAVPICEGGCRSICRDPEHWVRQKGGFNMGSDPSFPVLCATTLAIIMDTHGDLDKAVEIALGKRGNLNGSLERFVDFVSKWNKGGFNGDDSVVIGEDEEAAQRWKRSVEKVNGCPEMSKSPMSRDYLTVNSALFAYVKKDRSLQRVSTIHPGKLVSVLSGGAKAPDRHWVELLRCPESVAKSLSIDLAMRNWVPSALGGTGLTSTRVLTPSMIQQMLYAIESRPTPVHEKTQYLNFGIETAKGDVIAVEGSIAVDRKMWFEHIQDRYRSKGSIFWTHDPVEVEVSDEVLDKIVVMSHDPDVQGKCALLNDLHLEAADRDEIILHDVSIPVMMPFRKIDNMPSLWTSRIGRRSDEDVSRVDEIFSRFSKKDECSLVPVDVSFTLISESRRREARALRVDREKEDEENKERAWWDFVKIEKNDGKLRVPQLKSDSFDEESFLRRDTPSINNERRRSARTAKKKWLDILGQDYSLQFPLKKSIWE
jgi:hypothetical protein